MDPATPPDAAPAPFPRRAAAWTGALALSVAALDQVSKAAAADFLADGASVPVLPGLLDLRLAFNDGAAWSMLAGRRLLLCGVSAAMLGLLAGGILGNLADRLRTGLVVDFVDVHRGAWTFPTFNLADSAICVGVGLLLLASLPCFRTRPSSSSPRS